MKPASGEALRARQAEAFIRARLRVAAVASLPQLRLYMAHPGSGLSRLDADGKGAPPYWAYPWAGGLVLAHFLLDRPELVAGRRVLDLGAGSGLVGIAAAKAGARQVIAAETDSIARAAISLNAAENGVTVAVIGDDLTAAPPPAVDLVAVGDLFYEPALARRVAAFLSRCRAAGLDVLVGDPGRAPLPRPLLRPLAHYCVPDFGDPGRLEARPATVFAFEGAGSG